VNRWPLPGRSFAVAGVRAFEDLAALVVDFAAGLRWVRIADS
jgi:hypothetical protein